MPSHNPALKRAADSYQGYDPSNANYIQRYFWMSIDKKF
jgi:hypothetical protein